MQEKNAIEVIDLEKLKKDENFFDWDQWEFEHPTSLRENKRIKKHKGDGVKVYSHAPYAQELYEAYEGRLQNVVEPVEGTTVNGKVVSVGEHHAVVDINWREDAMIDLRKEDKDYLKYIQNGFPIEVYIDKIDNKPSARGFSILASYTKNIDAKKKNEILSSIGQPVGFAATVKELIHGGYFVDVSGVRCFMPGSLGGMNKLVNFEDLIGKTIYVMAINYSKEKDYIVVSHREYLKTLIPSEIAKLEFGQTYSGFVTGCSKHGIFVEFNGCLTGLIAKNNIEPSRMDEFDNRRIKPGDAINFWVSEIVDNDRIVLTQIEPTPEVSAWDDIENRYKIPSYVTGKVKRVVRYGVFVEIEPKIVGLLHKSHLSEDIELEVGQEIDVKIIKIDKEAKKLDFTM